MTPAADQQVCLPSALSVCVCHVVALSKASLHLLPISRSVCLQLCQQLCQFVSVTLSLCQRHHDTCCQSAGLSAFSSVNSSVSLCLSAVTLSQVSIGAHKHQNYQANNVLSRYTAGLTHKRLMLLIMYLLQLHRYTAVSACSEPLPAAMPGLNQHHDRLDSSAY
jgi:hypothetical protein